MKKNTIMILQIAATYIGTVVGAGFASGQSILQFFTVYGSWGALGIIITTFLFIWLGTKMMIFAHRIRAFSYQELNNYLFGSIFGKVVNTLTFIILFGVTSVMVSGTGSIFEEQLGLPYEWGIIVSIILSFWVMTKDMNGILVVNSLVVPMMLLFTLVIAIKIFSMNEVFQPADWKMQELSSLKWLISPFTYAALNFAFVQAVLVPLGSEVEDENVLKWGGIWGGIGLGFMLIVSHLAMHSMMPGIVKFEIPMAEVIQDLGWIIHLLFLLVIYGEIFTTLIGNVFGMTRQLQNITNLPRNLLVLAILLACFLISQIGFSFLLSYLYPIFGYMGMILLVFLAVKRLPYYRRNKK